MFVDDDERILEFFAMLFPPEFGIVPVTHTGPLDALADMEAHGPPHALLTDERMPHMSGLEFLSTVRTRFGDVPSAVVSGGMAGDSLRTYLAISKPFRPRELYRLVEELLGEALPSQLRVTAGSLSESAPGIFEALERELVSVEQVRRYLGLGVGWTMLTGAHSIGSALPPTRIRTLVDAGGAEVLGLLGWISLHTTLEPPAVHFLLRAIGHDVAASRPDSAAGLDELLPLVHSLVPDVDLGSIERLVSPVTSDRVSIYALRSIAAVSPSRASEIAMFALSWGSPPIRSASLRVLASCEGSAASTKVLRDSLQDLDPGVVALAMTFLGQVGGPAALEALDGELRDPDPFRRIEAVVALRKSPGGTSLLEAALGRELDNRVNLALWRALEVR